LSNYYASSPTENPQGPESGEYRVLRGGSWGSSPDFVHATVRYWFTPIYVRDVFGFRCARSYSPSPEEATEEPFSVAGITDTPTPTGSGVTETPVVEIGTVLLEEDFESDVISGWNFYDDVNWSIIEDGTGNHVLQGIGHNNTWVTVGESTWADYAFEVKAQIINRGTTSNGDTLNCLFRIFRNNEYVLVFNSFGLTLGRLEYFDDWTELAYTNLFINPVYEWMAIRIEVVGDTIRVYVNDTNYIELVDTDPLPEGRVGFRVQQTSTVWFDDVRVVELIPEEN
jgi:hypothetical protein